MMNTLFILDGVVVSSGHVPEGQSATLSGPPGSIQFDVPDDSPAQIGWRRDAETGAFSPPPAPRQTKMTPIRFKSQFTVPERLAIGAARDYSGTAAAQKQVKAILDILFGDLDDPRLMEVNVADSSVISGIDFVTSIGIITADRASEIKKGILT